MQVDFLVTSALKLHLHLREEEFDNVIDSGFFHTISDQRDQSSSSRLALCSAKVEITSVVILNKEQGIWVPQRVSKNEIQQAFSSIFKDQLHTRDTLGQG